MVCDIVLFLHQHMKVDKLNHMFDILDEHLNTIGQIKILKNRNFRIEEYRRNPNTFDLNDRNCEQYDQ
jgi:hypothetical protein